jgi:hypothetical protein
MSRKMKIALTILALPFFLSMYFLDRVITIAFPLAKIHTIGEWMFDSKAQAHSLIRVVIFGISIGLYLIISSFF